MLEMIVSFILNRGAELIGKKWRAVIIWHLRDGPLRFSELKRQIPDISVKVLSEVLSEMEYHKLIVRIQYNTIPVKVTYTLHPDAYEFMQTHMNSIFSMGEYLYRNAVLEQIPEHMLQEMDEFLSDHRKQQTKE